MAEESFYYVDDIQKFIDFTVAAADWVEKSSQRQIRLKRWPAK